MADVAGVSLLHMFDPRTGLLYLDVRAYNVARPRCSLSTMLIAVAYRHASLNTGWCHEGDQDTPAGCQLHCRSPRGILCCLFCCCASILRCLVVGKRLSLSVMSFAGTRMLTRSESSSSGHLSYPSSGGGARTFSAQSKDKASMLLVNSLA